MYLLQYDKKVFYLFYFCCSPQPSKKYVSKEVAQQIHDKAAPFVKWLAEAEEEESSEEEGDVEVCMVCSSH